MVTNPNQSSDHHYKTSIPLHSDQQDNSIAAITSPLKQQYIIYNPMDRQLAHLIAAEHQYLQFVKVMSTTRQFANSLMTSPNSEIPISTANVSSSSAGSDYHDLIFRSFSNDTTEHTRSENITEEDDTESFNMLAPKTIPTPSVSIQVSEHMATDRLEYFLNDLNLQEYTNNEANDNDDKDKADIDQNGDITFEDLERYDALLTEFESTRDEDASNTLNELDPQADNAVNTKDVLQDIVEEASEDAGDESTLEVNNSFTNYIRQKFRNEESSNLISNPQDFLRKASKIWRLMPQNLGRLNGGTKTARDIDTDQFHEFFLRWKQVHNTTRTKKKNGIEEEEDDDEGDGDENGNSKKGNKDIADVSPRKLTRRILQDPDVIIPEDKITPQLIEHKIMILSNKTPSSPYEVFFNDKLRDFLQDKSHFNMKKKQIGSQILKSWEKLSVLEKARYSSIVIDNSLSSTAGAPMMVSPSRRSVSYNNGSSIPSSRLASPKRSVSSAISMTSMRSFSPMSSPSKRTAIPELNFGMASKKQQEGVALQSNTIPVITPPISPPSPQHGSPMSAVKPLNKKKSWGEDDNWL